MLKAVFIGIIRFYQIIFSMLLGGHCRFQPTCSVYSMEAIKKFGVFHGSILMIKRLSRCHPFGGHGYDPLPLEYKWHKKYKKPSKVS